MVVRASRRAHFVEICTGALTVFNPMNCLGFVRNRLGNLRTDLSPEERGSIADPAVAHLEVHRLNDQDGRWLRRIGGILAWSDAQGF
jgi:hypothetical protein